MIIGIEAQRANTEQKTGVEHYAQQLILHLAEIDHVNSYVLYLRSKPQGWFLGLPKNFSIKVLPFPVFWTQLRISLEMMLHPVDVLFIPASALPIVHPKKSIVTIHDLAWLYYPQTFTLFNRLFLRLSTWYAVRFAFRIIAVSEATRNDLLKSYNIAAEKVAVVHHGFSLETKGHEAAMQDLPEHFILFLSTLQPRKNLEGLIAAFEDLKLQFPELPHKLVVVGKPGWKFEPIVTLIENSKDVVYLRHVTETQKEYIFSKASALVLPSFYEGFGMQILEAFASRVPVAVSHVSSMPEVAGEAAAYFDPTNKQQIKEAIKNILFDRAFAERLRDSGTKRLQQFSWKKCAEETLEVLKN